MVPDVELLGLVVVADAPGRLPRPLRDLARVVGGGFPRIWNMPWLDAWRFDEKLPLEETPRAVRQIVDELHALTQVVPDAPSTNGRNPQ